MSIRRVAVADARFSLRSPRADDAGIGQAKVDEQAADVRGWSSQPRASRVASQRELREEPRVPGDDAVLLPLVGDDQHPNDVPRAPATLSSHFARQPNFDVQLAERGLDVADRSLHIR